MESFMYAPVGVIAGRNKGDADGVSAPHSRQSITTCAAGGNPVWRGRVCSLTHYGSAPTLQSGGRSDSHRRWSSQFVEAKSRRAVRLVPGQGRGLRPASHIMTDIRIGPAGWSYSVWGGYVYPTPRPKGLHEAT